LVIFRFGTDLVTRWGERRFQRVMLQIVVAAAVVTVLASALFGLSRLARLGGWAVGDALVILWARQFPTQSVTLYGVLTLSGRQLTQFTIGVTALYAIYIGPVILAPELAACALAYWYPKAWLRSR
jgi:hypothetical protein